MHTGFIKYDYPIQGDKYILVDVSHYLPTQDDHMASQFYSNGKISLNSSGGYNGFGVWRGGWNEGKFGRCVSLNMHTELAGPDYTVYFCGEFDVQPESARLLRGPYTGMSYLLCMHHVLTSNIDPKWPNTTNARASFVNGTSVMGGEIGFQTADRVGALFKFPSGSSTIKSKIGVSWKSYERACEFLQEIPHWDVNKTVAEAKNAWENDVLSKIQVSGETNKTLLTMLYSALYRTGENPYWDDGVGYFDDICNQTTCQQFEDRANNRVRYRLGHFPLLVLS